MLLLDLLADIGASVQVVFCVWLMLYINLFKPHLQWCAVKWSTSWKIKLMPIAAIKLFLTTPATYFCYLFNDKKFCHAVKKGSGFVGVAQDHFFCVGGGGQARVSRQERSYFGYEFLSSSHNKLRFGWWPNFVVVVSFRRWTANLVSKFRRSHVPPPSSNQLKMGTVYG